MGLFDETIEEADKAAKQSSWRWWSVAICAGIIFVLGTGFSLQPHHLWGAFMLTLLSSILPIIAALIASRFMQNWHRVLIWSWIGLLLLLAVGLPILRMGLR